MLHRRLALVLVLLAAGCAHRDRRWLTELPLDDVVNHIYVPGVSGSKVAQPERHYDPALSPFIEQFVEDAAKHGQPVNGERLDQLRQVIYVDNLSMAGGPGVMAACNRYFAQESRLGGARTMRWLTIEVLRSESHAYTNSGGCQPTILLRELLYHELFHCLFNKGHLPKGQTGIMAPTFAKGSDRACGGNWDGLVKDMFRPETIESIPDAVAGA